MYSVLKVIFLPKFESSEWRAKICPSGVKSAVNIGVIWPNGAYNIEKVGLIMVAKSCSFFFSKKILSEYSSPSERLKRPAKAALASLTIAKLQTGKNARAVMKIQRL